MRREQKEAIVAETAEMLGRSKSMLLADFSGLNVADMTDLRSRCRGEGVVFRVIKNTLIRLASKGTEAERFDEMLVGPNALVLGFDEETASARVLVDFAKDHPKLEVKAGVVGDRLMMADDIKALAKLPGRDVLLAQLLGAFNGVPQGFVSVLAAVPRKFMGTLQAIADQKAA